MVLACSLVACPPGPAPAAPAEPPLSAHRFPTHLVTGPDASRVREIFREHSISRKHRSRFESTPKVYRYLLERIPLAATLIRVLRFGKYKITERPGGVLTVDSGGGLVLTVRVHHKSESRLVAFIEGVYRSWWTTGIHGRAAVRIRFRPADAEGWPAMENDFLGFIKFRSPVVEFFARVVNFFLRRMTDREIMAGRNAGRSLTEILAKNPARVYRAMRKSPEVSRKALEEFRRIFLPPETSAAR
jgi:hypothetical protein